MHAGLVNKRLALEFPDSANELLAEALQAFDKLHSLVPNSPEVIYQIAVLHETLGSFAAALDNFNILLTKVPTDPGVNLHVGQLFSKQEDEGEALRYHREVRSPQLPLPASLRRSRCPACPFQSYSLYPVNLDVISWLGVWFVKSEMYEQAIKFFERAAQIQPQEVKWRLMVASCYRRMNDLDQARKMYEQVHSEHPQNLECACPRAAGLVPSRQSPAAPLEQASATSSPSTRSSGWTTPSTRPSSRAWTARPR